MQLAGLGMITLEINQPASNSSVYRIDIACEKRLDVISMETKPDETVDQFCQRLRGMMRALWQAQPTPEKPLKEEDGPIMSGLKKLGKQVKEKMR